MFTDKLYFLILKDDVCLLFQKATQAFSSLGLSKKMLQSCIYDVAVTNDTSLAAQETLQEGEWEL